MVRFSRVDKAGWTSDSAGKAQNLIALAVFFRAAEDSGSKVQDIRFNSHGGILSNQDGVSTVFRQAFTELKNVIWDNRSVFVKHKDGVGRMQ